MEQATERIECGRDVPQRFDAEAMQLRPDGSNGIAILRWINGNGGRATRTDRGELIVTTAKRPRYTFTRVHFGWWVVKVGTEFFVCEPGAFDVQSAPSAAQIHISDETRARMLRATEDDAGMTIEKRRVQQPMFAFNLRTGEVSEAEPQWVDSWRVRVAAESP